MPGMSMDVMQGMMMMPGMVPFGMPGAAGAACLGCQAAGGAGGSWVGWRAGASMRRRKLQEVADGAHSVLHVFKGQRLLFRSRRHARVQAATTPGAASGQEGVTAWREA